MLTFSSEMRVKPDCNRRAILDLINSWFLESHLSEKWLSEKACSPFDLYESGIEFNDKTSDLTVSITDSPEFLLVQLKTDTEEFARNTFCIFREAQGDLGQTFYVGETLDVRKFGAVITAESAGIYAREIVRWLFWNDYQETFDGSIVNSDRTIFLTGSNLQDYVPAITGTDLSDDKVFVNPLLYVPYGASDAVQQFERPFVGQLHIFAEGSPLIANKLKELSGNEQPVTDSVFIRWADGTTQPVANIQEVSDDIDSVVNRVQFNLQDMLSKKPKDVRFSISHLREEQLRTKLGNDSDLSGVFESIIQEKESEISSLASEISALKEQLRTERLKSDALQNGFEKSDISDTSGMFVMEDQPKYDHEIEDIILRVLEKERDGMTGDDSLVCSRKYHVLCDILAHNFPSETGTDLKKLVKDVFTQGRLTRDGIGRLQSAGFEVEKNDKQAHYKISWQDDKRYVTSFPATPSDFRSGRNAASDFINICFGY